MVIIHHITSPLPIWIMVKKICDKQIESPSFAIGDSQVEIVDKTKYLGVQLDQHLVWDEHTRFLRAKVSRALGFLKYAKKLLPQETLSQIYRGIVEPHFRYCCSVWGELRGIQATYTAKVTKSR